MSAKKRAAVFFDRDNTLIVSDGYLGDPDRVVLVDGAADLVAAARGLGLATVVFSNQSGVARGMFDEKAVRAVNARLEELLKEQNPSAVIDRHEFCPFHPEATVPKYRQNSFMRKPKPGMIFAAARALALDLRRSWVVGDAPRDVEAGRAAGCRTILVRDHSLAASPAAEEPAKVEPDFVVATLKEAAAVMEDNPPPARDEDGAPNVERSDVAEMPAAQPPVVEETTEAKAAPDEPAAAPRADEGVAEPVREESPAEPEAPPLAASAPPGEPPPAAETPEAQPARPEETPALVAAAPATAKPAGGVPKKVLPAGGKRPGGPGMNTARLENLAEQILQEIRRSNEQAEVDFSVSKLLAGIVQVLALAAVFFAYLNKDKTAALTPTLLAAVFLQTLTIALLIMGKQK